METPLVSVLITAYNRKNYIADAVRSVLESSYTNTEILIVDDCSTDGTYEIARGFEKYSNVKIYRNEKNLGQFANRNFAATLARGKYIKYLDSDDTLYPHGLATMVDMIEKFPEAAAAISHDKLHEDTPYPILLNPEDAYKAFFLYGGFPNSGPSAAIMNREVFLSLGGFPQPFYVGTDSAFWLQLTAKHAIIKIPPALNWYRRHEEQAINDKIGYLMGDYKCFSKYLSDSLCPLNASDTEKALHNLKNRFLRDTLKLGLKKKNPRLVYTLFSNSGLHASDCKHLF